MINWKIPLFKMYFDNSDIKAVTKVIARGNYWAEGPEIKGFEEGLSNYIGTKYALTFNSGTSALHAVLLAYGVENAEVIVPSFTFISTANSVVLANGKPIFAEIEDDSYGLDPESVNEKITKKTRAIIPVHYGGMPCKGIKAIKEIAKDNKLLLIEDAAESFGAAISGKKVGTFGDSAMLSFCQNKVIATGEGGAIVTDSKKIFQKLKLIRSHGRFESKKNYFASSDDSDYIQNGYNYRMTSMIAALGISQLKKVKKIIKLRRNKAEYLNNKLSGLPELKTMCEEKNQFNVYQLYTLCLKNNKLREGLKEYLTKKGIMTKIYFSPVHLKTFYKKTFGTRKGDLPNTEKISQEVITLPMHPCLTIKEMDYICTNIRNYFDGRD